MGRNNNNAGMHLIWRKRYAPYDDLAYYDHLVAKQRKFDKLNPHNVIEAQKDTEIVDESIYENQEVLAVENKHTNQKNIIRKMSKRKQIIFLRFHTERK